MLCREGRVIRQAEAQKNSQTDSHADRNRERERERQRESIKERMKEELKKGRIIEWKNKRKKDGITVKLYLHLIKTSWDLSVAFHYNSLLLLSSLLSGCIKHGHAYLTHCNTIHVGLVYVQHLGLLGSGILETCFSTFHSHTLLLKCTLRYLLGTDCATCDVRKRLLLTWRPFLLILWPMLG